MKFFFSIVYLFVFISTGRSQDKPILKPGRTIAPTSSAQSFTDSADFAKIFVGIYPFIKPPKSVKEQAEQFFTSVSRSFKMQEIDSVQAAAVAFKGLDGKAAEKIYFDTYRRNLSAKELKKLKEFISTPEGKRIAEVWASLNRASVDVTSYITRTMSLNLTPLRQAAKEKYDKEHPPKPKMPAPRREEGNVPGSSGQLHPSKIDSTAATKHQ